MDASQGYIVLVFMLIFVLSEVKGSRKCFKRRLEYGKHFFQLMDLPPGAKTTNILRGSNKVYSGQRNSHVTFTVLAPNMEEGSGGFVVQRLCVFTKHVDTVYLSLTGATRKHSSGWSRAPSAKHTKRVSKKMNKFVQSCISPKQTPLDRLTLRLKPINRKGIKIQAQKLFMEACERI